MVKLFDRLDVDWARIQAINPYYAALTVTFLCVVIAVVRSKAARIDHIPGPFLARYTDALRAYMAFRYSGREINAFMKLHSQYGDVVRVGPRAVSVLDPQAVSTIYNVKARLNKTENVLPFKVQGVPESLLVILEEERHSKYRRPIQHAYALTTLKGYEPYVNDVIATLMKVIEGHVKTGESINISRWLYYWSYDVIGKITFGQPTGYLQAGTDFNNLILRQKQFFEYVNIVSQMPVLDRFLAKNPIFKIIPFRTFDFVRFAQSRVKDRALEYDSTSSDRPDLLSYFLSARETYPNVVNNDQVMTYCVTNVVAGSLSTSHVLDEIVRYLVMHPDAQQRIAKEVRSAGADHLSVTFDQAKSSLYLDAVIQEGFRIHTVANALLEREVSPQGMELPSGHRLPPRTRVGINAAAMNRREDIFGKNPHHFDPLRWLRQEKESEQDFTERRLRMNRADLTFGHGSRSCIGKNIVQLELFKVIATLATRFRASLEGEGQQKLFHVHAKVEMRGD